MIVTTLVENESISQDFEKMHGLSLHIKTKNHNILFDLGANDLLLKNSKKLNIDLEDVDIVVLSHGHSDHGGGLKAFMNVNKTAKIYMQQKVFGDYYTKVIGKFKWYVGLDKKLQKSERFIFVDNTIRIDDEIELFAGVTGENLRSAFNNKLLMKKEGKFELDSFEHELNMIIHEDDKHTLFAGCAHRGVVNIMNHSCELLQKEPDYVIGGYHLYNPAAKKSESKDFILQLGNELMKKASIYYTCHCTGAKAYQILHNLMGDKMNALSTGKVIEL